jgi:hypothetical protein
MLLEPCCALLSVGYGAEVVTGDVAGLVLVGYGETGMVSVGYGAGLVL